MKINLKEVIPGTVIDIPIMKDNVTLVKKGEVLTPKLIERLLHFGITEIDDSPKESIVEEDNNNAISQKLINDCKEALLKNDVIKIGKSANEMVSSVLNNVDFDGSFSNLKYDLTSYVTKDFDSLDNSLNHSIRVATFSIVLAYIYNSKISETTKNSEELNQKLINYENIATAALMHDIGKYHQDERLLQDVHRVLGVNKLHESFLGLKEIPLDGFDERFTEFYSYCIANRFKELPQNIKTMILYSNENENNTGPLKSITFRKEITHRGIVGAKIIHLCSLYDDYLSHCINSDIELENIIAIIGQTASNGVINSDLASLFLKNVPLYPVGTKVMLSNGIEAVVVKAYTGYTKSTRPVVKVIPTNEIIRLEEATSLIITGISKQNNSVDYLVDAQLKEIDSSSNKHLK